MFHGCPGEDAINLSPKADSDPETDDGAHAAWCCVTRFRAHLVELPGESGTGPRADGEQRKRRQRHCGQRLEPG